MLHVVKAERVRDVLENGTYKTHEATIILTSNPRIRKLNRRYGASPATTDVLTFRLADKPAFHDEVLSYQSLMNALRDSPYLNTETGQLERGPEITPDLGTIFMAVPYCHRLALKNGMTLPDYLLLCCVHGMAHLVGHNHDTPERYARMQDAERAAISAVRSAGLASDVPETYLK